VIAHERAHVRGRHDLVMQPFVAWQRTFPFLPPARHALRSVALLVEMLADDVAARVTTPGCVASALVRLGAARTEAGAPGTLGAASDASALVVRVRRLLAPPSPLPAWIGTLVYAVSAMLLIAPTLLLLRG
jgi:Zn-dependent protease with chaperone function